MPLFFRDAVLILGSIFNIEEYTLIPSGNAFKASRELSESLGLSGALNIPGISNTLMAPLKDNIEIKKLRIIFTIKKSMENSPSTASIKVYNLSKEKWNSLTSKHKEMRVTLYAGYLNNLTMLYSGDVTNASYTREGTDWVGSIETGDGAMANSDAFVNVSCEENSGILNAANTMLESFNKNGVNIENAKTALSGMIGSIKTYAGRVFNGSASKELEDLCQTNGHRMYVNNSELKIIPYDSPDSDKAIHLTPLNGLIGSPKELKEGIAFDTLLIPGMDIGSLVAIDSYEINGAYTINNIEYKGDTFGGEWGCKCEATEYNAPALKLYKPLNIVEMLKPIDTMINPEDYPDDWKSNYEYDKSGNYVGYSKDTPEAGFDRFYDADGKYTGGGS